MARTEIPITVQLTNGDVVVGASVTVRKRSDNSLATVYQAETGGTTVPNPLATDANGRVDGWVDRGAYVANITGGTPPVTAYNENFDASPAADGGIDAEWMNDAVLPIAAIMPYAANTDPSGGSWIVCDGRPLDRDDYAALFAKIGTTYGVGDGSSTFNVPDLRGRTPIGAGAGTGLTNRALGAKGGAEKHTLTTGEMPSHTHGVQLSNGFTSGDTTIRGVEAPLVAWFDNQGAIQAAGGNGPHENMPPFLAVGFIIRVQ